MSHKTFKLNQKVTVFDQAGTITEVIDATEPHLYSVTFDETGKQYTIEAAHIEAVRDERPAIERIKTFEDACNELGKDHPLVLAYQNTNLRDKEVADDNKDIIAYLKLRIIVAALNEGWHPQFTLEERRWYPYYKILTNDEVEEMSEEEKSRVVGRAGSNAVADGGLVYTDTYGASSVSSAGNNYRLAFKSANLAEYAGTQFIDIFADLYLT